ncbi:hypothetical protein ACVMIH_007467 [Bradyrhizobium sp. USDA 4503]
MPLATHRAVFIARAVTGSSQTSDNSLHVARSKEIVESAINATTAAANVVACRLRDPEAGKLSRRNDLYGEVTDRRVRSYSAARKAHFFQSDKAVMGRCQQRVRRGPLPVGSLYARLSTMNLNPRLRHDQSAEGALGRGGPAFGGARLLATGEGEDDLPNGHRPSDHRGWEFARAELACSGESGDRRIAEDSVREIRRIVSQSALAGCKPDEPRQIVPCRSDPAKVAGDIGTTILRPVGTRNWR